MAEKNRPSGLMLVGVTSVLTALAALGTMVIRIPVPATTGYFNIGDIFVVLAGIWLGPLPGLVVGGVGPTIADAIGFPIFIPATLVTKGLEGLLVGLIAGPLSSSTVRKLIAAIVGGIVVVVGYFLFEAFVYPWIGTRVPAFQVTDIGAATVELLPNTVQGIIGAAGGLALARAVSGVNAKVARDG